MTALHHLNALQKEPLELARFSGVHLIQGYLPGRPAAAATWDTPLLEAA